MRRFVVCLSMCHFVLVFFSPFSIAITSLGEERANLSAFRTFVGFVLVWICWFPLPLGVWEGLRFVIVALPGLFSYLLLVPCRIQVLSSICLVRLGNPLIGIHLKLDWVGEISLRQNTSLRRGEDIDHLLLPPLLDLPLCLLIEEVGDQRGSNTHMRGEEDILRHLLLPLQFSPWMIKEQDSLLRLQTYRLWCSLLGPLMRHLIYILIMWWNKPQRIHSLNLRGGNLVLWQGD